MKNYCCLFLLVFTFFTINAQIPLNRVKYADSLKKQLSENTNPTVKAKSNFLLAEFYLQSDTLIAKDYLAEGIKYSKNIAFMQAVSLYYEGLLTKEPKDAAKIMIAADVALKRFNLKEAFLFRSMCWHNYALIKQRQNNPKTALEILLQKAIPLAAKAQDQKFQGMNYFLLSVSFKNLNQFDKEKYYLAKAASILEKSHSTQHLAMVYQAIGENHITLGELNEAEISLAKMKALLKPYPASDMWLDYYAAESFRLNIELEFDQALSAIAEGMALTQKNKITYLEKRLELQKFYAFRGKKDFFQAKNVALKLANDQHFMTWDTNKLLIYNGLATCRNVINEPAEAYKWLRLYTQLNDSLNNKKLIETANLLEVKYRTAESQRKNVQLNAENERTKLAAKNSRLINSLLLTTCIFLFVLSIFGWFFYRNSKKLANQKDLNHQQELAVVDRQQQVKLVEVMLNAKEDEQNRVAKDLHDGLGGMLAVSKMNLAHYVQESKNNDIELQQVIDQLTNTMNELRRIAYNMMPEMLLKLGLEASLRDLCESLASDELKVDFQFLGIKDNLKSQEKLHIYRIVQEAMTNAKKHAEAKNLLLQCSQDEGIFFITIEDDGKGFDFDDEVNGVGLSNIRSRVAYLKGRIEILHQQNNQGTSINIELYVTA